MTILSSLTNDLSRARNGFDRSEVLHRLRTQRANRASVRNDVPASRSLRIGISTSVIQRGRTGVAQYVFALLREMMHHADEHEFTLFALEDDLPLFEFAADKMNIVRIDEKFRPAVKNILWHQAKLPGIAKQLGLDVLHVPSYRRMMWRRPCALVSTIHDLAPFHVRGKYDFMRMLYGRVVAKRLARRQDEIIAISGNTARDIETFFGIPESRQNVIFNGLDHDRFNPGDKSSAREAARQKWQLDQPFFLYVSRLEHPAKNHVRLIEAFTRFKQETGSPWTLALGGSDWHGAEVIHEAAKRSPFASDIRFLGFIDDADLPQLYRAAGAFVYPSLFEGFGLPPVEAMACGCPVISSTRGSLDEVVASAALRIDPESIGEMSDALHRMSSDDAGRSLLIEAGLANARRFDWQDNAKRVLEVYQKAVAKHAKA